MKKNYLVKNLEMGTISFGVLDRANKGTLLIDEVTEIPIRNSSKYLKSFN